MVRTVWTHTDLLGAGLVKLSRSQNDCACRNIGYARPQRSHTKGCTYKVTPIRATCEVRHVITTILLIYLIRQFMLEY